jgi:DHA1 family multidrug resistance protein-like MFS transporter
MPPLSALLNNYTKPGEEGAAFGLDNSIVAAARAAAPLLGAALAVWFGLRGIFVAAGVMYLLTALLASWKLPAVPKPIVEQAVAHSD